MREPRGRPRHTHSWTSLEAHSLMNEAQNKPHHCNSLSHSSPTLLTSLLLPILSCLRDLFFSHYLPPWLSPSLCWPTKTLLLTPLSFLLSGSLFLSLEHLFMAVGLPLFPCCWKSPLPHYSLQSRDHILCLLGMLPLSPLSLETVLRYWEKKGFFGKSYHCITEFMSEICWTLYLGNQNERNLSRILLQETGIKKVELGSSNSSLSLTWSLQLHKIIIRINWLGFIKTYKRWLLIVNKFCQPNKLISSVWHLRSPKLEEWFGIDLKNTRWEVFTSFSRDN